MLYIDGDGCVIIFSTFRHRRMTRDRVSTYLLRYIYIIMYIIYNDGRFDPSVDEFPKEMSSHYLWVYRVTRRHRRTR